MVGEMYEELFALKRSASVSPEIAEGLAQFEERLSDDTFADRVETITSEICSAGLLVPDPAGGATNLRFPHKQFYEYLICKGFCVIRHLQASSITTLLLKSSSQKELFARLWREQNAVIYLTECIGQNIHIAWNKRDLLEFVPVWSVALLLNRYFKSVTRYTMLVSQLINSLDVDADHFSEDLSERTNSKKGRVESHKALLRRDMIRLTEVFTMYLRFFYVVFFTMIASIGTLYFASLWLPLFDPSPWTNILTAWLAFVTLVAAGVTMAADISVRSQEAISKGRVFLMFLDAHWVKQDAWPSTLREFCRLARASAISGEVQFLGESPDDRADFDRHLSPAWDFERQ